MLSSAWYPLPRKSLPKKRLEKGRHRLGRRSVRMDELAATVLVVIVGFTAADATDRGVHFHRAQTFGQPSAPEYAGRRAIAE